jgi:Ca2+-binding RTX toxin-like protein
MWKSSGRFLAVVAAVVGAGLVQAVPAWAESCSLVNGKVTAEVTPGSEATLRVSGTEIWFGQVPAACGAATTANTGSIEIRGGSGTAERVTIDESGGTFTPGNAAEGDSVAEIEIEVRLFDANDVAVVRGTAGNDAWVLGESGLRLFTDNDADVTFPAPRPELELDGLAGADSLSARGGGGAGSAYLGLVTLAGGDGDDELSGAAQNDLLEGGGGNDKLSAAEGNDMLRGGAGADQFLGSYGNDIFYADDGAADASLNGGPGLDYAIVDGGVDPRPSAVETVIPAGPACRYDNATKAVTAYILPGSAATLKLVGNEIWFGFTPEPCGGATATNTDSISITGAAGASETLVLDERGGVFGPGATSEFNLPEIEISTTLGDATDTVVLYATDGDDVLSAGQLGVALNSDGDVDVTFSPAAFELEVHGLAGNDHINARGQGGAGLHFLGPVILHGGDGNELLYGSTEADELYGGPGDDELNAQAANDVIEGGPGNDQLDGGSGSDVFFGGYDDDLIYAEEARPTRS